MNSVLTYALIDVLASTGNIPTYGWRIILIGTMESVPAITLVPRFILSLRKLYARDLRGRRGSDIDIAFGLTSGCSHGAVVSVIMFADARQNERVEQGEEIQMEERETRGAGSSGV